MKIEIPWASPSIGEEELLEVTDSFKSGWLSAGPKVERLESQLAVLLDTPNAIAVTSGTMALELVLRSLNVGPGDEVILPALTYFATAASISNQHAVPVFADIDSHTWNLDPDQIAQAVTERTKAIVFIDYGGNPANYDAIKDRAVYHGIPVVQDGAQSLGAKINGRPVGAQANYATMSFHVAKLMTTIEGGMIFTRNERFAAEIRACRNQGEKPGDKYIHSFIGCNARMTDLQAAVGLAQVRKLNQLLTYRRKLAARYDLLLRNHSGIQRSSALNGSQRSYFFYPVLIDNRDEVSSKLRFDFGIDTRIAYPMPVYRQPVYASGRAKCRHLHCPITELITSKILNLPIFPTMAISQIDKVAHALLSLCK